MPTLDWKKLIGGIAPVIGTALGGPLAGEAISMIGRALGLGENATESDVAALAANGKLSGDQIVALQNADQVFKVRMEELRIDVIKINQAADDAILKDVQDARARQVAVKDRMPEVIFTLSLIAYVGQFLLFIYGKMPDDEFTRALVTRAFGTIDGVLLTAVAFFLGSSRGSKASGDAVRKIAEQSSR